MGSADALGPAVLETMDRADDCSDLMRNFIQRSATYLNAIFVPLDGVSYCSSSLAPGETIDMHGNPIYQQFLTEPGTMIKSVNQGALSGRSVVVVLHPLYRDSEMLGYIALSLTQELLRSTHAINFGTEGCADRDLQQPWRNPDLGQRGRRICR